jgi:hypothetical protein
MPVIPGIKSECEKFAGAESTHTIEGMSVVAVVGIIAVVVVVVVKVMMAISFIPFTRLASLTHVCSFFLHLFIYFV